MLYVSNSLVESSEHGGRGELLHADDLLSPFMWLIFLLRFDASGLFTRRFDHQCLVLACRAPTETETHQSGVPVRSPDAAPQNGLIHAVNGLQLHAPLIIQHTCMRACTHVSLLSLRCGVVPSCLSLFPELLSCSRTLRRLLSWVESYINPRVRPGQVEGRVVGWGGGLLRWTVLFPSLPCTQTQVVTRSSSRPSARGSSISMRMLVSPPKRLAGPLLLLEGCLGVRALCKWSHVRLDTSPDLHSSTVLFLCPVCMLLLTVNGSGLVSKLTASY